MMDKDDPTNKNENPLTILLFENEKNLASTLSSVLCLFGPWTFKNTNLVPKSLTFKKIHESTRCKIENFGVDIKVKFVFNIINFLKFQVLRKSRDHLIQN